jgi:hypothetical protein
MGFTILGGGLNFPVHVPPSSQTKQAKTKTINNLATLDFKPNLTQNGFCVSLNLSTANAVDTLKRVLL